jgi:transposase, IS30 family
MVSISNGGTTAAPTAIRSGQAPVYFCDPHSPWQRGTNENTNRLLRFWFEKSLSVHTKADLKRIQDTLNKRPRPTLDLDTPADRLAKLLDHSESC